LPVTASFGVGVGIGIGVDFCRSVFARFLANCIPSLAEFLVAKRHPDLLFDPDTDTDPDPDFIRFLCLSLSANWDRGAPRGAAPPTPPGMRITHRAVPLLCLAAVDFPSHVAQSFFVLSSSAASLRSA
jgi:hypothetical protein